MAIVLAVSCQTSAIAEKKQAVTDPCQWRVVIENTLDPGQPHRILALGDEPMKLPTVVRGVNCTVSAVRVSSKDNGAIRTRTLSCSPPPILGEFGPKTTAIGECIVAMPSGRVRDQTISSISLPPSVQARAQFDVSLVSGG